ncbi:polyprenyl synthetase family protein [Thermodesulfobacteriota bacterium]
MFELKPYIKQKNQIIDAALEKVFQESHSSKTLVKAMKYSLMAGGKQIRPVLCLAACEAVGGAPEDALTAACALEMIHTYSLIHDDLPAMDDDELRRGKATCHIAFNEATAVLAGDALLTLAFEMLSSVQFDDGNQAFRWLKVIRLISEAAGYRGMIQGQMLDIASEGIKLSAAQLETMHRLKTGALIETSLACGALLGGADGRQTDLLSDYGRKIGLAFQVADDILNVEGNPALMGKAVGTDRQRHKSTYPSVLGIQAAREFSKKLVQEALQALETFDKQADPLRGIARYIIERKR